MRRSITPILLLAAVALSTGVVLPRFKPLQPDHEPVTDQSSDPHITPPDCEALRKLYHMTKNNPYINWEVNDNNNVKENYNKHITKRQGGLDQKYAFDNTWLSYARQINHGSYERNYFYQPNPYDTDEAVESSTAFPLSDVEVLYERNKNILIAYYMYDTYVAATIPFDNVENKNNCVYDAISRSPFDEPGTDTDNLEMQEEREKLNKNEIPVVTKVVGKRFETEADSDAGQKEIPDNLELSDGENNEVQKKLFSFWSRLQALSHKGRQLPTRRHTFVYYGPDGTRDGPLTAETRASHLRPPGQPLRWG